MTVTIKKNGITFFSKHPVLADFSKMLADGIELKEDIKNINVYVGLHQWDRCPVEKSGINVGLQTEQYFDFGGRKLWACPSAYFIYRQILKYDVILDLSKNNIKAYNCFPKPFLKDIVFGPYIFPSKKVAFLKNDGNKFFFAGRMNSRRELALAKHFKAGTLDIVSDLYGAPLTDAVSSSRGVVNIHYENGRYIEWPRFLIAYLSGKLFYSEELAPPLILGTHYLPLGFENGEVRGSAVFNRINEDIVTPYRFELFIQHITR